MNKDLKYLVFILVVTMRDECIIHSPNVPFTVTVRSPGKPTNLFHHYILHAIGGD